jgi:hypothetical protein
VKDVFRAAGGGQHRRHVQKVHVFEFHVGTVGSYAVIDNGDFMTRLDEAVDHVGSDEPAASGNRNLAHVFSV